MGCLWSKDERPAAQRQSNAPSATSTAAAPLVNEPTTVSAVPSSSSLAFVKALPAGAVKAQCYSVYDGDTLSLTDRSRVRLLGVDTPELKEKEPFAEEAKRLTQSLCERREIWLVAEGDPVDKYERLLRWIYVPAEGGFTCVNIALVEQGLAVYYHPSGSSSSTLEAVLLQAQSVARSHARGKYAAFEDADVFVTSNGRAYHQRSCRHIAEVRIHVIKKSAALDKGMTACRTCLSGTT